MKKRFWLMSVILALALVAIFTATAAAAATFKVSDLSISPTFISAGSGNQTTTTTISVKIANTGTEAGNYQAELKINDNIEATKDVALKPGENQTVMFPITKTAVGEYNVSIGDLKGVFSVAPAGLEVKNLLIDPIELNPGKEVVISVTAQNKLSDQPLSYDSLKLFINGAVADKKRIDLKAGESATISFRLTKSEVGDYVVQIGSKTGKFTVKASFFASLPTFVWAIIGAIVLIIIIMAVMVLTSPKKKKPARMAGKPGMAARGQPYTTPVQPIAVQPPFGQRMPQYPYASEQMPPYPGQMPQSPPQQGMPQYPGQQQQMPPRPTAPFPGQPQMPQQPFGQQQMPPQPFAPQQPPYPGQAPQTPPPPFPGQQQMPPYQGQAQPQPLSPGMPQYPGQQQRMPPRPTQPLPGQQQMPQQPFGQQQMPPQPFAPQQPPYPGQMPQSPPPAFPRQQQMPPVKPEPFGAPPAFTPMAQPGFTPQPFGMPPGRHMPQFNVSNLTITPQQVKEGDPVNISAVVSNNSTATGHYSMVLRIGGVVENISELTLNPGASQTALFTVIKDAPGEYYVEVDGQRGILTVIHRLPAAFSVSNLTITPDRVKQAEPITITAIVTNSGETTGNYSVVLRIKGIAESIEEVELGPGRSQKVIFTVTKDAAGFYPVALENLSGRFVVEMDWKG